MLPRFTLKALFKINPKLGGGTPYVVEAPNYKNYTRPQYERSNDDHYRQDFTDEVMEFLNQCEGYKIGDWVISEFSDPKYGLLRKYSRTIWFLEAGDAIQFKLIFGCNDQTEF